MTAIHGTSGSPTHLAQKYELLKVLDKGGMGTIYLARQHGLNRHVCVKTLSIPEGEDADLWRARFCREAELLASVSHPHILSVFDFGATADSGLSYLVTEFIEAGDLRRLMSSTKRMPLNQVRSIIGQIGDALTFLHDKGILHRDLKPENVLMPTDAFVKVGDFGIAVLRDKAGQLTRSDRGMGTAGYVSPEQQYGLKLDERTDEYSLAAVCYELLTGKRPLGSFPPPSHLNRQLTHQLDTVVLRGLAEEPKDRFRSVREFVVAFDQAVGAAPTRSRLSLVVSASLIGTLAVLVTLAWIAQDKAPREMPITQKERLANSAASPTAPNPAKSRDPERPPGPPAKASERSPAFKRLVELRAYTLWVKRGRPTGRAGEAVREANWIEAERQILAEVKARAFKIWDQQGRPNGAAGEAVREKNMRSAETQLLSETETELR